MEKARKLDELISVLEDVMEVKQYCFVYSNELDLRRRMFKAGLERIHER